MTPEQWTDALAQCNALYQKALQSADFGRDVNEWLDFISGRADTRFELFPCEDWPADRLSEVHWCEIDACGLPTTESKWMYLVPGQAFSHHDFVEIGGSRTPVLSYDGASLFIKASRCSMIVLCFSKILLDGVCFCILSLLGLLVASWLHYPYLTCCLSSIA
ncbi:hypothetical protein CC86DRAFT_104514 [Ophiobolus disseminans]|uniref:Uncharacterized protein n=1 Tax=Ophiobolus disseminans TaxID=1469910 RepID=A0A6A6ZKP9_9PLEO|nr:hypothetical protein CC86DRAFT_104514 [Ophiobolus disseminans]